MSWNCSHCSRQGTGGHIGEQSEIEFRDQALVPPAILHAWADDALGDHLRRGAEVIQRVQHVHCGGGWKVEACIFSEISGACFKHLHGDALAHERIGSRHLDRASTGDQNRLQLRHGVSPALWETRCR